MAGATRLRHAHWHGVSTLGLEGVSEMAPNESPGASRCVDDAEMTLMLWPKRSQNMLKAHKNHPSFWFFTLSALRNPLYALSRLRLKRCLSLL